MVAVVGMVIAYYADIAPGGSVVLTAISLLVVAEMGAVVLRMSRRNSRCSVLNDHAHAHESHAHGADGDGDQDLHSHR